MLRDRVVIYVWVRCCEKKRDGQKIRFFLLYILHKFLGIIFCNDLSTNVSFQRNATVRCAHCFGLIVGSGVCFKGSVLLRSGNCIGERVTGSCGAPIIGDGVEFGVGAIVLGDLCILEDQRIKPLEVIGV